ncbi:MAG: hypothetical protein QNK36_21120 [Colwellia sp.]|nr:hypothetical protein [Colwellia sp.]
MTKQTYAFYHDDISSLAKSLKTQLSSHGKIPGHTQLLHMLAKATGHQNYMAWKEISGNDGEALINLKLNTSRSIDIFSPNQDGTSSDPRNESIERLYALIEVEVSMGKYEGSIWCKASASKELVAPSLVEDRSSLFNKVIVSAIAEQLIENSEVITVFGDIDVDLDEFLENDNFTNSPVEIKQVRIASSLAKKLRSECTIASKCSEKFDEVKELLWTIFHTESPSDIFKANTKETKLVANYLDDYIKCQGSMFLTSWNNEKLGYIAECIKGVANGKSISVDEWEWMSRDIYSARSEPHWKKALDFDSTIIEKLMP